MEKITKKENIAVGTWRWREHEEESEKETERKRSCSWLQRVKKWNRRVKAPHCMLLGFGAASFLSQFMNMSGAVGGKSFIASVRITGGPSVDEILKNVEWPEQFPFKEEDFQRYDESPDTMFYESPRFVPHIDDPAIASLTSYYSKVFPVGHFPPGYRQERVVGLGLNEEELKRNPVLTDILYKT